jgi:predicted GNAT superfamily acetyltransferase
VRVDTIDAATDLTTAADLLGVVWATASNDVAPAGLLRAWAHAGEYVAAAWVGDQMAGASAGFFGRDDHGWYLHSHVTGVAAEFRGRHIGAALKRHQQIWARERGIDRILWTFDPLIRRNALFNLRGLGARIVAYEPNFYGPMDDGVNRNDETDRCVIEWRDGAPAAADTPPFTTVLDIAPDDEPIVAPNNAAIVGARVPDDIVRMRQTAPDRSRRWRHALRDAMSDRLHSGYDVLTMTDDGTYVMARRNAS